ncbi:MAG: hypothetical protein ACI9PN_002811 [Candidatus Azotimanducaceae bacterium]|jgi:hypothetical protein
MLRTRLNQRPMLGHGRSLKALVYGRKSDLNEMLNMLCATRQK